MIAGPIVRGQQPQDPPKPTKSSLEVALVYNPLMSNLVGSSGFWMQGGSVQVHGQFWRGLGVVADVSGLHTANTNAPTGVGLDLVTATFGPRYTWSPPRGRYAVFGQVLAGEVNGFHSVFPGPSGASDSADGLAVYIGGGLYGPSASVAVGYIAGSVTHNSHLQETAVLAGEAMADSIILNTGLGYAIDRQTPMQGNGRGDFWPHGTKTWPDGQSMA